MPWLVRLEQEVNYKLFSPVEQGTYFSEFLVDSLLRGDIKSRNEAYQIMRRNGVLNADEWRERENLNPLPDGQGQKYIVEQNMQGLDQVGEEGEPDE
jgi:HK97 family phage portal protein